MDSSRLSGSESKPDTVNRLFNLSEELIEDIGHLVLSTGWTTDANAMRETCHTLNRIVPKALGGVASEGQFLRNNLNTNGVSLSETPGRLGHMLIS
jgi:hypothetical protein